MSRAHAVDQDEEKLALLLEAAGLYLGEFMPGFYENWACELRDSLSESYLTVLRSIARLYAQSKRYELALRYAHECVNLDPIREESHRDIMRIYAAMGQPSAALKQFEELEKLLRAPSISASYNGVIKSIVLHVHPALLSKVTLALASIQGGLPRTGKVYLDGLAGAAGLPVTLRSSDPHLVVPGTITVGTGKSNASFGVTTKAVTANVTVTVTATAGSVSTTTTITITP